MLFLMPLDHLTHSTHIPDSVLSRSLSGGFACVWSKLREKERQEKLAKPSENAGEYELVKQQESPVGGGEAARGGEGRV
jgi:hypothetical protein